MTASHKLLKFLNIGRIAPSLNWHIKNHKHDTSHEMIVVKQGTLEVNIAGKILSGGPGHALLYPAGVWHSEKSIGATPLETWFLGWQNRDSGVDKLEPYVVLDNDGRLRQLCAWIYELRHLRSNADPRLLDMLCFAVWDEYTLRLAPTEPAFLRSAKAYIEKNLTGKINLPALAYSAGMSPFHFARTFRKSTGQTPGEYLRRRRMEHVRSLILSTPLPLRIIAKQNGFSDEYVLSKTFKKVMGVTPGSLRKS
jgi:AraC-like DNA-binding protein